MNAHAPSKWVHRRIAGLAGIALLILTTPAAAQVSGGQTPFPPRAASEEAATRRIFFLKLPRRVRPAPRPHGGAEASATPRPGDVGVNPALTAPLEMPLGDRPQRFMPTFATLEGGAAAYSLSRLA